MNKTHLFETIVGTAVLVLAVYFAIFSYQEGGQSEDVSGYELKAKFDGVDGLSRGSDVRISGIKVGSVSDQSLDTQTYQAVVSFSLSDDVKLPKDSSAEIVSDGLLGGKYLSLIPGGDETMLQDGEFVPYTQSSVSLEKLIGKFAFGSVEGDGKDDAEPASSALDAGLSGDSLPEASPSTAPAPNTGE